jgi:hypothetical protein
MNAENPAQIDLFGVSATRTKDTRLAEHIEWLFVSRLARRRLRQQCRVVKGLAGLSSCYGGVAGAAGAVSV